MVRLITRIKNAEIWSITKNISLSDNRKNGIWTGFVELKACSAACPERIIIETTSKSVVEYWIRLGSKNKLTETKSNDIKIIDMVPEYKTGQNYTIYNLQVIIPVFFMEREVSINSSCCKHNKIWNSED